MSAPDDDRAEGGRERRARLTTYAVHALVLVVALAGAASVYRSSAVIVGEGRVFCLFDDAMISLRYAENLVTGRGLVWNEHERVEGYSNPAWVLVMAVARGLFGKVRAVVAIHALGVALAASSVWLLARVGRSVARGADAPAVALTSALLGLTLYPLFFWSWTGMDTGPLTALLLACVARELDRDDRDGPDALYAFGLGLACLLRPDAPLFVGGVLAFRAARRSGAGRSIGPVLREALLAALPTTLWVLFRVAYYEEWLPNTYYLKATGFPLMSRLRSGAAFVVPMLAWAAPLVVVTALRCVLDLRDARRSQVAHPRFAWLSTPTGRAAEALTLFALFTVYQIWVGGDAWPPTFRLTVPAAALLIPNAAAATWAIGARFRRVVRAKACALVAVSLCAAVACAAIFGRQIVDGDAARSAICRSEAGRGMILRQVTTPRASIAVFAAGIISYYSELYAIDALGRTDPVIARQPVRLISGEGWRAWATLPGHNKYDLRHTLVKLRPTVVGMSAAPACAWGEDDYRAWCQSHYVPVRVRGYWFLLAAGSPHVSWDRLRSLVR